MIYNSITYLNDIKDASCDKVLKKIYNNSVMITGACGLIGSFLVDVLMKCNELYKANITVIAYDFKEEFITNRFANYLNNKNFKYIYQDVNLPLSYNEKVNYIMHLASNAHPLLFKTDPVGTIKANIIGLNNLLSYAKDNNVKRLLYVSTGEVYGECESNIEAFDEEYSGYVNPTLSRSCYPSSKRTAETLCVSYSEQYGLDTVIARPCHIYGPTMTKNDSRVYAEFIRNILDNKDIVLKSNGKQKRSYCYVLDACIALLYILVYGENKNAYNIANRNSITTIYDMAHIIAKIGNREVKMDIPKGLDSNSNPMQCAILNSSKLEKLGFVPRFDLEKGYTNTIKILKEIK